MAYREEDLAHFKTLQRQRVPRIVRVISLMLIAMVVSV